MQRDGRYHDDKRYTFKGSVNILGLTTPAHHNWRDSVENGK
jgi:hypothetical protein